MKHTLFTLSLIIIHWGGYTQQLFIGGNTGFAIGETSNLKKIMLVRDASAGFEARIKGTLSYSVSLVYSYLQFSHTQNNVEYFNTKRFLILPVQLKKYYFLNKNARMFLAGGPYAAYFFTDKKEFKNPVNQTTRKHNLGYNFGMSASIGVKFFVTTVESLEFGFNSREDILYSYKDIGNKIKLIPVALSFHYVRLLNKMHKQ
jgi:hypothetical protein